MMLATSVSEPLSPAIGLDSTSAPLISGPRSSSGQRFLFVDNVRFLAMFAVVAQHGATMLDGRTALMNMGITQAIITPLKFGTIGFFLISGFLLGDRFETAKPSAYLGRRFRKVFLPWLFWVAIQITYWIVRDLIDRRFPVFFSGPSLLLLVEDLQTAMVRTAFWFIPNLLVSICLLMLFRKYLRSARLGIVLLAFTLFYAANIYGSWVPAAHTEALFGFVFYLWLGAFASKHFATLTEWIARIPASVFAAAVVATLSLSFGESQILMSLHSGDPVNTLRLSNQLFSVAVVLLLIKWHRPASPRFINVGEEMFGVYLTHTLIFSFLISLAKKTLFRDPVPTGSRGIVDFFVCWIVVTAFAFLASLAVTRLLLRRPGLAWAVGDTLRTNLPLTSPSSTCRIAVAQEIANAH